MSPSGQNPSDLISDLGELPLHRGLCGASSDRVHRTGNPTGLNLPNSLNGMLIDRAIRASGRFAHELEPVWSHEGPYRQSEDSRGPACDAGQGQAGLASLAVAGPVQGWWLDLFRAGGWTSVPRDGGLEALWP